MRTRNGFTVIEMLIVIAIIGIIAAIAIPSLMNARVNSVAYPFKTHFGIDISSYANARLSEPPNTWLSPKQKAALRPYVQKRLAELCATPQPPAEDIPPAMDPGTVQLRLQALSQEGSTAESKAKACSEAKTTVNTLGLSVEVQ